MKLSTKQKQKIARQAYKEICESLNIPSNMILESIDSEIIKESDIDSPSDYYAKILNDKFHELGYIGDEFISEILTLERTVLQNKSTISIVGEIIRSITKVLRDYDGMKRGDVLNAMLNASRQK